MAKDGDSPKRARGVTLPKGFANDCLGVREVALFGWCGENSRAEDILQSASCRSQSNKQILHRLAGLR